MNKIISFILIILLGAVYGLSGIFLTWCLVFILLPLNLSQEIFIGLFPLLFFVFTTAYFIKRRSWWSIIALLLGIISGWMFLMVGISMSGK